MPLAMDAMITLELGMYVAARMKTIRATMSMPPVGICRRAVWN
jgi:hypothetical protein